MLPQQKRSFQNLKSAILGILADLSTIIDVVITHVVKPYLNSIYAFFNVNTVLWLEY